MKLRTLFAFLLSIVAGLQSMKAQEAYAVYTSGNTTLTFYYDNQRSSRTGATFDLNTGEEDTVWGLYGINANVTNVVFDSSFANARPTTTHKWFYQMTNLQSITGMGYLNTSEVTSMYCMFFDCRNLTSLNVSSFNTSKVTDMGSMLNGCNHLGSLNISNFDTSKVLDMSAMFQHCYSLTSLELGNFDVSNVTTMKSMFLGCSGLTSLDLSSFNTSKVTDMSYMFQLCTNLKTIYVGNKWSTKAMEESTYMFRSCSSLVGGAGTRYNENRVSASYAHIDGGTSNPGYFTDVADKPKAYACYTSENSTLTFFFDNQRSSRTGTTYDLNIGSGDPDWISVSSGVAKVVFDSSFADARPTSTRAWFYMMYNLQTITGMEYLNTSEVTNMFYMFADCKSLTSLDLSHFNTANVTNMDYMFWWCDKLESLDLSSFNTSQVINMSWMFFCCKSLTSLNLSSFNTEKVLSTRDMFSSCESLTSLDLSNFNTEKVLNMSNMFSHCSSLTSLDLSNFNTTQVTDMNKMFLGCNNLTSLDVSSFNTANVTSMIGMFCSCRTLTSLDLSSFNTAKVTDMSQMFDSCDKLTTIYVGNSWSTDAVTDSERMFNWCTSLVGGAGTTFNANHKDASYAHIDGGTSNPGYFTGPAEAYACYTSDNTTLTFYYDNQRYSRPGTTYDLNTADDDPRWLTDYTYPKVTKVVFNSSFADARPTTTYSWFYGMEKLQTIIGIEYLNTSEVAIMDLMFHKCYLITSLDLSGFNTAHVTDMQGMFCHCRSLTALDLSHFYTSNVKDMTYMFYGCEALKTIYVDSGWSTDAVIFSDNMFVGCTKLVGGAGTRYDAEHVDASYAHIDYTSNPGYLTLKPYTFEQNGIWYKDVGYGCVAVTYKDENYFSYSGDVVIPESVTTDVWCYTVSTIGERAFYRCPSLKSVVIPATVDIIDGEAFVDCFDEFPSQSTITCLATTPPMISPYAVGTGEYSYVKLYVPAGTKSAYQSHSVWKQFANIIELPLEVDGICYKVTGDGTVSVTSRDDGSYSGNVVIPATVTCNGTTFTVTAIEAYAFQGCAGLTDITIPETVTQIGAYAFQGCTALEEGNITCLATVPPTITGNTFGTWHYKGASLYVPYGCYDAYASADYWKNFSDIYELEEVVNYDLWIAGIQVTSTICADVLGNGTVSYNPSTNTLTLTGANIRPTTGNYGIQSKLQNLDIKLIGENTINASGNIGVYLQKNSSAGATTFIGDGSLYITSNSGALRTFRNVVLKDGAKITAESTGDAPGFQGRPLIVGGDGPTLTLQGEGTELRAKGGSNGSLMSFKSLTLNDGLEIIEPEGATYSENEGVVILNRYVANEWVVIAKPEPEPEAYVVLSDDGKVVTFYYDTEKSNRSGVMEINEEMRSEPDRDPNPYESAETAVFDASFDDYRPTSTANWFNSCYYLTNISGMEYLHTENVTDMRDMFYGCYELTSLDLSHFNTANVIDMCEMFDECRGLTSLDLSTFNTANVIDMFRMFYYCMNLTVITVGEGWSTDAVINSEDMFCSCTNLVGGAGTTYDWNHRDASYAHIDGGTDNPGYLSQEVETYKLWIAGTQVTSANMNDVLGDGTVSYNPDTNTLTLNGANISANGTQGIRAISANFMINVIGNNNVEIVDAEGVSLTNRATTTMTFYGSGLLNIKASDVGIATNGNVVLKDGVQIRTESTGSYGMEGSKARAATFYPKLTMQGRETILMAKGSTGAITHFNNLIKSDDIAILEPTGATFVSNDGIVIDGTPVTNEWVVIANQAYIDGISLTPALSKDEGEWYDLQGRKVMNPRKGIYIKDGKRVLVK